MTSTIESYNNEAAVTKTTSMYKTTGIGKEYAMQKKKEHDELWKKVNESPELVEIVRLKEKLEEANIQRNKTNFKITEMKKGYDAMKKDIQGFIREQSSAFHKLNYPKRQRLKTKNKYEKIQAKV